MAGVLESDRRGRRRRDQGRRHDARSSTRTRDGTATAADRALEELLLRMWQIRAFELRAMELFEEKLIRGSVHPYIGMEAIAVGVCAALGPNDYITSTHRGHGHCVAKGLDLSRMMAEIIGREDGYCRGRGGSMHITAIDRACSARTRSSAGSSALAVGAAHGLTPAGARRGRRLLLRRRRRRTRASCTRPATSAPCWTRQVVFVCENNQWAISTPAAASTRIDEHRRPRRRLRLPGRDRRRQRRARGARRHRRRRSPGLAPATARR